MFFLSSLSSIILSESSNLLILLLITHLNLSRHFLFLFLSTFSQTKMEKLSNFLETSKPYFAMISLQFGYAGMNIITKVSLNRGMSHYVLVVYRHAFATAIIAPFAIFFERYYIRWYLRNMIQEILISQTLDTNRLSLICSILFRKAQPKITFPVFMQIFILALLGLVVLISYN